MKTLHCGAMLLVFASLAGCNLQAGIASPTEPPPTPFEPPATFQPSSTPAPMAAPTLAAPTPSPSPTPDPLVVVSDLLVSPLAGDVICRFGPGMIYSVEARISTGTQVNAHGRNVDTTWLHVDNPARPGKLCWAPVAELAGAEAAEALPVVPPPNNIVTKVSVDVAPSKEEIPCADLPFTYDVTFTLTTTGPLTVEYEADSSEGQALKPTSATFQTSGTFSFSKEFKVESAGDHWYRVDVLGPNEISGEGKARLSCTP